jgi:uncharacterized protein YndB with AHSA1/START domain
MVDGSVTPVEAAATHRFETRRVYAAPRQRVFEAWTQLEKFVQWWGHDNRPCADAALDLRPGGQWYACLRSSDGDESVMSGEYRVIDPPNRIVFTWSWDRGGPPGVSTLVSVDFIDLGGQTEIRLVQEGFQNAEIAARHNMGWSDSLDRLARLYPAG